MLKTWDLVGNDNYGKNYKGVTPADSAGPCLCCGKTVRATSKTVFLHVHGGGTAIVTEAEAATMSPAADLGLQPIGPDCVRNNRAALAPYLADRKAVELAAAQERVERGMIAQLEAQAERAQAQRRPARRGLPFPR